jgi:hypothetical protein
MNFFVVSARKEGIAIPMYAETADESFVGVANIPNGVSGRCEEY